ncbi:MAG TPA: preprotein translocase subunit SecG [Pirellulales bacterium]|nr:preprotein translocase subunit SecG [Pirellulales bacterium]
MEILIMVLMFIAALFLIVLILLQRGRGGGLAGALGGMGGQSAFGTKAGDVFTKITSGLAIFWILLCVIAVKYMGNEENRFDAAAGSAATPAEEAIEAQPDAKKPGKAAPAGRAATSGKSSPAASGPAPTSSGGKASQD